jgi:hypothetical protein
METFLIETRSGWSFSLGCWDWVIFIIKLYWEILTLSRLDKSKVSTYWEISIEKYAKISSWSRLWQTVKNYQNFQISTDFSFSIKTFGSGSWSQHNLETDFRTMLRSRLSIETKKRQIETPKPRLKSFHVLHTAVKILIKVLIK